MSNEAKSEAIVERFPNAPIVEALLEIGVSLPSDSVGERFLLFHDAIKAEFPIKKQRFQWTQQIQIPPEGLEVQTEQFTENYGSVFLSNDGKKIVQVSKNSFAYSQLKPYDCWAVFKTEAKSLWDKYREILKPLNVNKIGLRYVNRIVIPLPVPEFRDFCLLFPEFPPGMPQSIGGFFMRFNS